VRHRASGRAKLPARLKISDGERRELVKVGQPLGKALKGLIGIVSPRNCLLSGAESAEWTGALTPNAIVCEERIGGDSSSTTRAKCNVGRRLLLLDAPPARCPLSTQLRQRERSAPANNIRRRRSLPFYPPVLHNNILVPGEPGTTAELLFIC